jgi:hypothetical protein
MLLELNGIGPEFANVLWSEGCSAILKLLVALWKYVTAGVVIEGAAMKNRLTRDAYPKSAIFQDLIVLADPGERTVACHGLT